MKTREEWLKTWNALSEAEREKRRGRSVCCPAGHPEVWNPQAPLIEWAWNVRAYKVDSSSYCRACGRGESHGEQRSGRWFNEHGWLD